MTKNFHFNGKIRDRERKTIFSPLFSHFFCACHPWGIISCIINALPILSLRLIAGWKSAINPNNCCGSSENESILQLDFFASIARSGDLFSIQIYFSFVAFDLLLSFWTVGNFFLRTRELFWGKFKAFLWLPWRRIGSGSTLTFFRKFPRLDF